MEQNSSRVFSSKNLTILVSLGAEDHRRGFGHPGGKICLEMARRPLPRGVHRIGNVRSTAQSAFHTSIDTSMYTVKCGAADAVWYSFLTQPLRTLAKQWKDPEAHHPARFSCDIYPYFGLGICGLAFRRPLPTSD